MIMEIQEKLYTPTSFQLAGRYVDNAGVSIVEFHG